MLILSDLAAPVSGHGCVCDVSCDVVAGSALQLLCRRAPREHDTDTCTVSCSCDRRIVCIIWNHLSAYAQSVVVTSAQSLKHPVSQARVAVSLIAATLGSALGQTGTVLKPFAVSSTHWGICLRVTSREMVETARPSCSAMA